MCVEAQYDGVQIGNRLYGTANPFDARLSQVVFGYIDYVFAGIYNLELIARVGVLKRLWTRSKQNWLDALIVVVTDIDIFAGTLVPSETTLARLFRLGRLLRMTRLVRCASAFESVILL